MSSIDVETKQRNKLTEVPDPPPGCTGRVAKEFIKLCKKKLANGGLFEDEIQEIWAASMDKVMSNNALESRQHRLKKLKLKSDEPIHPDVELRKGNKFDERFDKLSDQFNTYEEAWKAVEEQHKAVFGEYKYKNYEAYRKSRARRIKRKVERCSVDS